MTIAINTEPVANRAEPLHEIWWQGRQWAVTAYVLEALSLNAKTMVRFPPED